MSPAAPPPLTEPLPLSAEAPNLREISGYDTLDGRRIARGRLYRSDQLNYLSAAELSRLKALGVRTIVDLRLATERERHVSPDWPDASVVIADVLRDFVCDAEGLPPDGVERLRNGDGAGMMCDIYRSLVELPCAQQGYRQLLEAILRCDGATLFHCSAGQDRTGWGAALVLRLLGVPDEHIKRDYLLSVNRLAGKHARLLAEDAARYKDVGITEDALAPLFWVRAEYLDAAFEHADRLHGSFERYVEQALGMDARGVERLRLRLLE